MTLHGVVRDHRARQVRTARLAQRAALQAWQYRRGTLLAGWSREIPELVHTVRSAMTIAATGAGTYVDASLTAQGAAAEPVLVNAPAFAETAEDGRALGGLLYLPAIKTTDLLNSGQSQAQAMRSGLSDLLMYVGSEVANAGRAAVSAAMVANQSVKGYYREPGAGACDRCAILSGKWFGTFQGASFDRHPRCKCTAIPAAFRGPGNPVAKSPQDYFASLSPERQAAVFGKANAQAIRDGADIFQVVNAQRGMETARVFGQELQITLEGTTTRGLAGQRLAEQFKASGSRFAASSNAATRLTPQAIYQVAGSRENAIRLLRQYGYLL